MLKRPEGRKRLRNTFQQFSIAKKACFRKIPEADFSLISLSMLKTACPLRLLRCQVLDVGQSLGNRRNADDDNRQDRLRENIDSII